MRYGKEAVGYGKFGDTAMCSRLRRKLKRVINKAQRNGGYGNTCGVYTLGSMSMSTERAVYTLAVSGPALKYSWTASNS